MSKEIEEYFKLLYPNVKDLKNEEAFYAMKDYIFIDKHIEKIHRKFENIVSNKEKNGEEIDESKIIVNVVNSIKSDRYFELLHPEFETLTPEEEFETMRDMAFIAEHIGEIDRKFQDIVRNKEKNCEEINKQAIIKSVIEGIKDLQTRFSVQQIGKATKNASIIAKKEVEQVENENTRYNIKEGEEVGDGK